jgi:hypothetical protein
MSLPVVIDTTSPQDTDLISYGASQIRSVKSSLVDLLGLQSGALINSRLSLYDISRNVFVIPVVLDSSTSSVSGALRFVNIEPEFYDGTQWKGVVTGVSSIPVTPLLGYTSVGRTGMLRYGAVEPEYYNGSQWIGLLTGTSSLQISNKKIFTMQVALW